MSDRPFTTHWAGLVSGPGAWALSTQVQYAATPLSCALGTSLNVALALILAACAVGGGVLSYGAMRRLDATAGPSPGPEPRLLLARVSVLAAALFALGILLQGAAGLFLTGCQR
jgi:hypothetical protein